MSRGDRWSELGDGCVWVRTMYAYGTECVG